VPQHLAERYSMIKRNALVASVILSCLAGRAGTARAEEDRGDQYASMVVQNRTYSADHELSVFFGTLPLDAFTKGVTLSGSYTMHFSELWAWEVVHAYDSFHVDTSLKEDLAAFGVAPTPFEVLRYHLSSNVVFKPIYWKGAWLNQKMVHGELLLVAGGGYGWFTRSQRASLDLGLGMRFYLSKSWWARLDVRHNVFFNDSVFEDLELHHELWAAAGVSLAF
jgi:outer membrane beta-barrel protein